MGTGSHVPARPKLFTIGVYGSTRAAFFAALEDAGVDLLLDVRRRRAVRGSEYSYANAGQLTDELAERGIAYKHVLGLAPDPETLDLQGSVDASAKRLKSDRTELSPEYVAQYTGRTLDVFDFAAFAAGIREFHAPVIMCIERIPQACHRSLIAPKLARALDAEVVHLIPSGAGFDAKRALARINRQRAARRKKFG